jgi:hypothetical protein
MKKCCLLLSILYLTADNLPATACGPVLPVLRVLCATVDPGAARLGHRLNALVRRGAAGGSSRCLSSLTRPRFSPCVCLGRSRQASLLLTAKKPENKGTAVSRAAAAVRDSSPGSVVPTVIGLLCLTPCIGQRPGQMFLRFSALARNRSQKPYLRFRVSEGQRAGADAMVGALLQSGCTVQ